MRVCGFHNCALSGECAFGETVSVCSDSSVSGPASRSSTGGGSGASTGAFSSGGSSQRSEPLYTAATKKPAMAAHTKNIVTYASAFSPSGAKGGGGSGGDGGSAISNPGECCNFQRVNSCIIRASTRTHTHRLAREVHTHTHTRTRTHNRPYTVGPHAHYVSNRRPRRRPRRFRRYRPRALTCLRWPWPPRTRQT